MSTGDSLTPTLVGTAGGSDTLPAKPKADASGRDRLAHNVLASWGGHLVFIVAGFAMPRLIDSHLGQASLGIWDFGWSIVSYFVLAQVGVGSSVNRYVAKYRSVHDVESLRRTVSSVNVIQMGATLLVLSITACLTYYLPILFGARLGVETVAARWVIALLGASVATQMAFNVFGGVVTGCHRWDVHNAVNSGAYAVIAAGMAAAPAGGAGRGSGSSFGTVPPAGSSLAVGSSWPRTYCFQNRRVEPMTVGFFAASSSAFSSCCRAAAWSANGLMPGYRRRTSS